MKVCPTSYRLRRPPQGGAPEGPAEPDPRTSLGTAFVSCLEG